MATSQCEAIPPGSTPSRGSRRPSTTSTVLPEYKDADQPPTYDSVTARPEDRRKASHPAPSDHTHAGSCGNPASAVMAVMGTPSSQPEEKRRLRDRLRSWTTGYPGDDDPWGTKAGSTFHLGPDRSTTRRQWNVQGSSLSDYGALRRSGRK